MRTDLSKTESELSTSAQEDNVKLFGVAQGFGKSNPPYFNGDASKLLNCVGTGNGLGPGSELERALKSSMYSQSEIIDCDDDNINDVYVQLFVVHNEPRKSCTRSHTEQAPSTVWCEGGVHMWWQSTQKLNPVGYDDEQLDQFS